jgi:ATP-binding cassette subfamily B (MDR/TAP) protein 1
MFLQRIRTKYLESVLQQEISFFDEAKEGSLISRLTKDVTKIQQATGENTGKVFQSSSTLAIAFVIAFGLGWRLALVM